MDAREPRYAVQSIIMLIRCLRVGKREPAADLPVAAWVVDVLLALAQIDDPTQNRTESLEIDRLQNPAVHPEFKQLIALVLEQRCGHGEDGYASVEFVRNAVQKLQALFKTTYPFGCLVAIQERHSMQE